MKTGISANSLVSLASRASTFVTCWRIERTDGVIFGFTNHRKDIVWSGEPAVTYKALGGYTPSAIATDAGLAVDNMELEGLIKDNGITDDDVREGLFDYADVLVFKIDYKAPEDGRIILKRGNIGELKLQQGIYLTEIRGLAQRLVRSFIRVVTPDCDAQLFDTRCKLARTADWFNTGVVTAVLIARRKFEFTIEGTARVDGFFNDGLVRFIGGAGANRYREVKRHTFDEVDTHTVTLFDMTAWTIAVDDTIEIETGCDKLHTTCIEKFDNFLNFRGFHKVPGTDKMLQYPDFKEG